MPVPCAGRAVKWSTCALTGQPLAAPTAADWLGNLFNRAAALEFLLGRAAIFADDAAQVCLPRLHLTLTLTLILTLTLTSDPDPDPDPGICQ